MVLLAHLPLAAATEEPASPPPVLDLAELDEVPVPLLQPKPAVPADLNLPRHPEPIEVGLVVDATGVVRDARVLKPAAQPALDAAALSVLPRWRFRPGHKDGQAVAARMVVSVAFLDPEPAETGPFRGPVIVPVEQLDRMPMVRYQTPPVYPSDLQRQGIGGEVVVEFVVDERGMARSPRAINSPHTALSEAAENAVGQWTFFPGMKDGRAVSTRIQVPIEFTPTR